MCGIVGQVAERDVYSSTLSGLARVEYRGYDSFGIASILQGRIVIDKRVGSVSRFLEQSAIPRRHSLSAIAHTRWATHGQVSEQNAHPHISFEGSLAVAHNGIVENYLELKEELENRGIHFRTSTDSEVICHLIAEQLNGGAEVRHAIRIATRRIAGTYAIVVLAQHTPGIIYGITNGSPLIASTTGNLGLLASDALAAAGTVRELIYLKDGDLATVSSSTVEITRDTDDEERAIDRVAEPIELTDQSYGLGGFEHYMLKEIYDAAPALAQTTAMACSEIAQAADSVTQCDRVAIAGSGSSFYVAQMGQWEFMRLAGTRALSAPSDEICELGDIQPHDALILLSQSGETFDTVNAARQATEAGASVVCITNVHNSLLERVSTHRIQQRCGVEVSVLSTKSVLSQALLISRLALEVGLRQHRVTYAARDEQLLSTNRIPASVAHVIQSPTGQAIQDLAYQKLHVSNWFVLGRGSLYPVALEFALKFREVTYQHAEGIAAGSLKHGTISLIDDNMGTIVLLPSEATRKGQWLQSTLASVAEVRARGGHTVGFGDDFLPLVDQELFDTYIGLPLIGNETHDSILHLVTGQLYAYYRALALGREIDKPRGLAKAVTVR